MAIVWGSVVGSGNNQARIGINVTVTNTSNTQSKRVTEIWFWSKYAVSDTGNTFYYNDNASSATTSKGSVSISTSVNSGEGWSTSNQKKIATYTYTFNRGTSASKRPVSAKLTGIDIIGSTMTASTTYTIPALPSYKVEYKPNGGSGVPGEQTKYYGETLTLSSIKPTRSGYTFVGWGTSATDTSANYNPGGSYTANEGDTLYAIWKKTIKLTYNANGGSGVPSAQSATVYNATTSYKFTIPSTKPTRTGYTFRGYSTSSTGSATYSTGSTITLSASDTLYAVWQINKYTIHYDDNGGTGKPKDQIKKYGINITLSSTIPTRSGYRFLGWATSATGSVKYAAGATYSSNADITLYAVWERLGILHINMNGTWGKGRVWINDNGTWKTGIVFQNVSGTWKQGGA